MVEPRVPGMRRSGMRSGKIIGGLACLVLAGCASSSWPAEPSTSAICLAPTTVVSPGEAAPGQLVIVSGDGFWNDCADQGISVEVHAAHDLPVTFNQGGTALLLDRVDATGDAAHAEIALPIPSTATAGPATIAIGSAAAAEVIITG